MSGGPVWPPVLSPAPEDRLERRDWRALADRVLGELGLGEHQAVVALHTDTDHPHLHLAVNRVHPGTLRAWDRWQDRPRIEGALRRIEREWGLRRVPGRLAGVERGEVGRGREGGLSQGQKAGIRHRAAEPQGVAWRRELGPAFREARSWSDLAVRLQVNGVHLRARGRGLVVTDGVHSSRLEDLGGVISGGRGWRSGWGRGRSGGRGGGSSSGGVGGWGGSRPQWRLGRSGGGGWAG